MKALFFSRPARFVVLTALLIGLVGAAVAQDRTIRPQPDQTLISARTLPPLFNGKNFDGWIIRGGKGSYEIEPENTIVGTVTTKGGGNTFLCTEKEYADFLLELDVKADEKLNSGIQIRSHYFEEPKTYQFGPREIKVGAKRVHGYQVEVDQNKNRRWGGGIYEEARRLWLFPLPTNSPAGQAFKFGDWNHYRIRCVGSSIKTWVNDVPAADLLDAETLRGFIGLQVHSSDDVGTQVRFRNVRLRDLGEHDWQTAWDCQSFEGLDRFNLNAWKLDNGVLQARHSASDPQPATLQGRTPLYDFTIRFKYKLVQGGFDLAFRTSADPETPPEFSFRLNDKNGASTKMNEWNVLTMMVQGKRAVVNLNGHQVRDTQNDAFPKGVLPATILAGGEDAEVYLKDFEILLPVQ